MPIAIADLATGCGETPMHTDSGKQTKQHRVNILPVVVAEGKCRLDRNPSHILTSTYNQKFITYDLDFI
jgi:hypothetical protein